MMHDDDDDDGDDDDATVVAAIVSALPLVFVWMMVIQLPLL